MTQKFTTKELDAGIELTYFGARYYDQDLGVWTSPDPARQFHSVYSYDANPINVVDPDGLSTVTDGNGNVQGVANDGDLGVYSGPIGVGAFRGETQYWDEFAAPEPGFVAGRIFFGSDITQQINGLNATTTKSLAPAGPVGWIGLGIASQNGHALDIKGQLGQGNGYLYDGKYISGKSAGNILFGMNARSLGIPYGPMMWGAGKYNLRQNGPAFADPTYKGESTYSGRRIEQGYNGK